VARAQPATVTSEYMSPEEACSALFQNIFVSSGVMQIAAVGHIKKRVNE
jgi:hypothetical protein